MIIMVHFGLGAGWSLITIIFIVRWVPWTGLDGHDNI